MVSEEFAFTEERAGRIIGVSARRLRTWSDLVPASITRRLSPRNTVRLYSFDDVLALRVVSELSSRRVPTRVIRRAVEALSASYDRPLTQLTWAQGAGQVYFQHPDGGWTGGVDPLQVVFRNTIDLEPLRQSIREAAGRPPGLVGRSERHRGRVGSKEVFAGTRIPVDLVRRALASGRTESEVLKAYPGLEREDLMALQGRTG